jgi:hypothetical protein
MKVPGPSGHLDQLLRQTRAHHVSLSAMADMKANILLTVAAVLMTLTLQHVRDPDLRWSAIVLTGACLLTLGFAVYAVMPKLGVRRARTAPKRPPTFNVLFFGDFVNLEYEAFVREMEGVLASPEAAYEAQVREVYGMGHYLARKKFRFLRYAYLALLLGLASSALILLVAP